MNPVTQSSYDPHHPPYDEVNKPAYPQIPVEVLHPTNWRRVGRIVLSVLLLTGLVNAGIYLYLQTMDAAVRAQSVLPIKWSLLRDMTEPVDWLILGDSSANQGISPDLLTDELGGTGMNLATFGDTSFVNAVWMLDDYLARFEAPAGVVLVLVYDHFGRNMELTALPSFPLPIGFWRDRTPQIPLSTQQELDYLFNRFFPLYTRINTLGIIAQSFSPNATRLALQEDGFMRQDTSNLARVASDAEGHLALVRSNTFAPSATSQQAMVRLLFLMDEHDLSVYFKPGPLYEGLWEDADFRAYWQSVLSWLENAARTQPGFCVLPEPALFPASQMENADHIIYEAAVQYTAQIAQEIQACGIG